MTKWKVGQLVVNRSGEPLAEVLGVSGRKPSPDYPCVVDLHVKILASRNRLNSTSWCECIAVALPPEITRDQLSALKSLLS